MSTLRAAALVLCAASSAAYRLPVPAVTAPIRAPSPRCQQPTPSALTPVQPGDMGGRDGAGGADGGDSGHTGGSCVHVGMLVPISLWIVQWIEQRWGRLRCWEQAGTSICGYREQGE